MVIAAIRLRPLRVRPPAVRLLPRPLHPLRVPRRTKRRKRRTSD